MADNNTEKVDHSNKVYGVFSQNLDGSTDSENDAYLCILFCKEMLEKLDSVEKQCHEFDVATNKRLTELITDIQANDARDDTQDTKITTLETDVVNNKKELSNKIDEVVKNQNIKNTDFDNRIADNLTKIEAEKKVNETQNTRIDAIETSIDEKIEAYKETVDNELKKINTNLNTKVAQTDFDTHVNENDTAHTTLQEEITNKSTELNTKIDNHIKIYNETIDRLDKTDETKANKTDVELALEKKQNKLTAGQGLKISDTNVITLTGDAGAADVEIGNGLINDKGPIEIDTTIVATVDKTTELEGKITQEISDRETKDNDINAKIDALQKIYIYNKGIVVKANDIVIYANKLYVAQEEITLSEWDVDEPKLVLTDSDTISCVTYIPNIKISKGQLVIYDSQLFLCNTTVENTTAWDADKTNMTAQKAEIDLTDYYNKKTIDNLLLNKENALTVGDDIEIDKNNNNTIKVISKIDSIGNSIAKRGIEGSLKAAMPQTLSDDTVINNKKLNTELDKVNEKITNEINARTEKDTDFEARITSNTTNIATEVSERKEADVNLENKITTESSERSKKDIELEALIGSKQNKLIAGKGINIAEDTNEISAAVSADDLQIKTGNGIINKDGQLEIDGSKIPTIESVDTKISTVNDKIIQETTDRTEKDAELQGLIDTKVGQDEVDTSIAIAKQELTTAIDLKADKTALEEKQNKLTAGTGINISDTNEISAVDQSIKYTQGDGIIIEEGVDNNTIKVDDAFVAKKADLDTEIQNRTAEDAKLQTSIDNLLKVHIYAETTVVKQNELVLRAGKVYIANEDITLSTWDVDEPKLTLTDSDTISCVTYDANMKIEKGKLVIYNSELYLCETTVETTTNWEADKNNFIAQKTIVDLTNYFTKEEATNLLNNKTDKTVFDKEVVDRNAKITEIEGKIATEITDRGNADTEINTKIGDLNTLNTSDKTSIVKAINSLHQNVSSISVLDKTTYDSLSEEEKNKDILYFIFGA